MAEDVKFQPLTIKVAVSDLERADTYWPFLRALGGDFASCRSRSDFLRLATNVGIEVLLDRLKNTPVAPLMPWSAKAAANPLSSPVVAPVPIAAPVVTPMPVSTPVVAPAPVSVPVVVPVASPAPPVFTPTPVSAPVVEPVATVVQVAPRKAVKFPSVSDGPDESGSILPTQSGVSRPVRKADDVIRASREAQYYQAPADPPGGPRLKLCPDPDEADPPPDRSIGRGLSDNDAKAFYDRWLDAEPTRRAVFASVSDPETESGRPCTIWDCAQKVVELESLLRAWDAQTNPDPALLRRQLHVMSSVAVGNLAVVRGPDAPHREIAQYWLDYWQFWCDVAAGAYDPPRWTTAKS